MLLTDEKMPYMCGTDFVRENIIKKGLDIPVIFLTGGDPKNIIALINNNPKLQMLEKPMRISKLEAKVKELLNNPN